MPGSVGAPLMTMKARVTTVTNVNPEKKSEAVESGSAAGAGLPLRGLAMVLIAVAVLLAMWGLYATTRDGGDQGPTDTAASVATGTATAQQTEPADSGATAEESAGAPEDARAGEDEPAAEADRPAEDGPSAEDGRPAEPVTSDQASPAPEAKPAPVGGAEAPAPEPERVHVLNNSTVPNLAADVADSLDGEGYRLGEVGNLAEVILPENTVFFQPDNQDAEKRARELADRVGGVAREYDDSLPEGTTGGNDLTLVLVEQVAL